MDYKHHETGISLVNLLTNSGFGVWSNSGLTQGVTGRQTDFNVSEILADADGSSFASWVEAGATMTDAGANLLITEAASGGTQTSRYVLTVEIGKLYKVAVVTVDGTGAWGATDILKAQANGGGALIASKTGLAAGTHSIIFEATAVNNEIEIFTNLGAAGGTTLNITSIYVDEVTPGCVAADALGPDGWYKDTTLDVWRQHNDAIYTKDGAFYSLKAITGAASDFLRYPLNTIRALPEWYQRFAGRIVTVGVWVYTDTASHVRIEINDGVGADSSSYHTGGSTFEWIEVTYTVSTAASQFWVDIRFAINATTAYISQPMLVFGSSIGEGNYVPSVGAIVNCEKNIALTDYTADAVAADATINLESQSNGMIPKGCKAVHGWIEGQNSAADKYLDLLSASGGVKATRLTSQVANIETGHSFRAICNSNGDIYIDVEDANWDDVTIEINAIE
ncbi:MAG: hypothetical protein ABIH39_01535 [Candidatus Margulisiibacteriota bacterium]